MSWRAAALALCGGGTRALSSSAWRPPAHRMATLFPETAEAAARNADPEAVFVVTGANRGIGAAMVAALVARTRGTVVACARDPSAVDASVDGRVRAVALDVTDDASVAALPAAVGGRVDVLVHGAGVLHRGGRRPERSLDRVDRAWLLESFDVNCAGPALVTRALRRALDARKRPTNSVVASLSARVGSITDNGLGGWYAYRASKAAQNMVTRNLAIELRRQDTRAVALHPGTTDTDLSAPFQANVRPEKLFPPDFVAAQLLAVIDGLEDRHSGGFFDWAGEPVEF